MAAANDSWKVLPHHAPEKLDENLWRVEGQLENMPLKRVMTVARTEDGRLVIHNAIAMGEAGMAELESWGVPSYLVVPNGYHRLDAPAYKKRYPNLRVVCPRGARKKVERVVPVDMDYAEFPSTPAVTLAHLDGCGDSEGVMIVRSPGSASLVLNDVLFNMPHLPGFIGFVFKHVTQSSGGPRISRVSRMFVIKDKARVRAELEKLADTPDLRRIVVSHHLVIHEQPAATLRQVAATL